MDQLNINDDEEAGVDPEPNINDDDEADIANAVADFTERVAVAMHRRPAAEMTLMHLCSEKVLDYVQSHFSKKVFACSTGFNSVVSQKMLMSKIKTEFFDMIEYQLTEDHQVITDEDELSDFVWEQIDFYVSSEEDDVVKGIVDTYGVFKAIQLEMDEFGSNTSLDSDRTEAQRYASLCFMIVREQIDYTEVADRLRAKGLMRTEEKTYRINAIDFDFGGHPSNYGPVEADWLNDSDDSGPDEQYQADVIAQVIEQTWRATDEEDLIEKISRDAGWLINSINAEEISEQ